MNQQFMQQPSYGPPPSGVPQNYPPPSKISPVPTVPSQAPGGFQNVPLGPSTAHQSAIIEPQPITNKFAPPANTRPPASQLPPGGQLPNHPPVAQITGNYQQNGAAQPSEQKSPDGDVVTDGNAARQQLQDGVLAPPPMRRANIAPPGGGGGNQGRAGLIYPQQSQIHSGPLGMPPPPPQLNPGQPSFTSTQTRAQQMQSENGPIPTPQSIFGAPPPQQQIPDAAHAQQRRPPVPGQQQTPQMSPGQVNAPGQHQTSAGQPQMSAGQPQMSIGQANATGQPQMSAGQPQTLAGQQQMPTGQPQMSIAQANASGQPIIPAGQPQTLAGQPQTLAGQPQMSMGQPQMSMGQYTMPTGQSSVTGQSQMSAGQHQTPTGQPQMSAGQAKVAEQHQLSTGQPQMSTGQHQISAGQRHMSAGQANAHGQPQMLPGQPQISPGQPHMSTGQQVLRPGQAKPPGQSTIAAGQHQTQTGHMQMPPGQPQMSIGQANIAGQPQISAGQRPTPTGQHFTAPGRQQMPTGQSELSTGHNRPAQMQPGPVRVAPISAGHHFGPPGQQLAGLQGVQQQPSVSRPPGMPPPVLGRDGGAVGGIPPPTGPPRMGIAPPMKQSAGPGLQQGFNQPPAFDPLSGPMQGMTVGGPPQGPPHPYHAHQTANMNGTQPLTVTGPSLVGGLPPHMPPPINAPANYHMNGGQQQQQQQLGASGYPLPPQAQGAQMAQQYAGVPPPMTAQGRGPVGVQGGGYPQQQGAAGYMQQQQQKRLDPDQMPSQIQVTEDDQALRSGKFYANQKGLVPPLVTTTFTVMDQGYASPRFIRSTMYNVPVSNDLMKQTSVPFALVISPMARTMPGEYTPPCVDFGAFGPVRCIRCKAYMGPYMQFIDSGRRFVCVFCRASTEVPTEYFQHLDHTGMRMDRNERPELVLGTYELTATVDYCRNNTLPKPPAFIFIIDVSYNSIKSGLVHLICAEMKQILGNLPIDPGQDRSRMRVGFITYDRDVHFYNIKGDLAAPQMLVVGDTHEMFMPLLDGFLCTPEESEAVVDALMEQIPNMFGETKECETILLPAITAGLEALKASECVGKLLVFHSTLPTAEAPGKLKNRDERKLLGTDKERTVLTAQSTVYAQLGQECVAAGCSVDLYLFNNAYIDIATVGQVARITGGEVFKYTYFQADLDGTRLLNDIITNISRPIAFDSIMRVRTSTGVRPTDFYGHFYMSNTTDIELAAIDSDKAIAVEIKHDDKLSEEDGVYIQVALLYTSCSGVRRLRIINQALKTCSQMSDLYRSCDLDTIVNFFGKQSVWKLLENNPKVVKDGVVNRAAQMLANYRKNCANPSSAGQLILPECMKLLPLYVNCLLKSDAISGGADITLDDRSFVMQAVMTMDVPTSVNYFYPRLLPLHEMKVNDSGDMSVPPSIRCSIAKFTDQGVYILENGIHMFMWIGLAAYPDFIQQVFGVASAVQINTETPELPQLDNAYSKAVHSLINNIRRQRHRYMRLTLVRQREKLEPVFRHFLVEDQGVDNSASYVDFLCHMHKEIRTMLS